MQETLGNCAALASSFLWAWSTIRFRRAIVRHGAMACNFFKAAVGSALFLLTVAVLAVFDSVSLPPVHEGSVLLLSGVMGMAFGDFALFTAIHALGARQATLLHATSPLFLLLFSLFDPSDSLSRLEWLGIMLVVIGVLDVTRRSEPDGAPDSPRPSIGIAWGLAGAAAQAIGILLAKSALAEGQLMIGSSIRLIGGTVGMALAMILLGRGRRIPRLLADREIWSCTLEPVLVGTYLGVAAMMLAIFWSKTAVAGALLSLTPIFLVPMCVIVLKERFDLRILFGTVVAVTGVVLLGF